MKSWCLAGLALCMLSQSSGAEAQRLRPQPGVEILRRGQGLGGAASPDGHRFAYWGSEGLEVYDVRAQQRTRVATPELGAVRCAAIGWSSDGQKVAFSYAGGIGAYDTASGNVRVVHVSQGRDASGICDLAYDHEGKVIWRGYDPGPHLAREGQAPVQLGDMGFVAFVPAAGARRVLLADHSLEQRAYSTDTRDKLVHAVDLTQPTLVRRSLGVRPQSLPFLDDRGQRMCYRGASELECLDLATGNVVRLGNSHIHGPNNARPFSSSGNRVIFNRDWNLVMHDFETGAEQVVTRLPEPGGSIRFRGASFEDDNRVLLFEHIQQRRATPAIIRVELSTGDRQTLLQDRQQYCYLHAVGDTLFGYRTNTAGAEDFMRVHLPSTRAGRQAQRRTRRRGR